MIRPIVKSPVLLDVPSEPATIADMPVARDLAETLAAHADECVGMAANMIGVRKRIIVANDNGRTLVIFNPEILETHKPFETQESCLSLEGERPCTRYERIKVAYLDENFESRTITFTGFTAQIIQHEIDHCNGIVI